LSASATEALLLLLLLMMMMMMMKLVYTDDMQSWPTRLH